MQINGLSSSSKTWGGGTRQFRLDAGLWLKRSHRVPFTSNSPEELGSFIPSLNSGLNFIMSQCPRNQGKQDDLIKSRFVSFIDFLSDHTLREKFSRIKSTGLVHSRGVWRMRPSLPHVSFLTLPAPRYSDKFCSSSPQKQYLPKLFTVLQFRSCIPDNANPIQTSF